MSQVLSVAEAPDVRQPPRRRVIVALVAVMIPMVLATLDNTIIGTAIPTVVAELGGLSKLSWVITAYTLATAASTPIWGKLADMYGGKGVFVATFVIFLAGSVLAGAAQTMTQLIAFRALQGLGGGGLMVCAFAIMVELLAGPDLPKYQGIMSAVMGVTMMCGPLVGGFLTDYLGWRWCFYVNVPIGAVAMFLVITMLRLQPKRAKGRIDYLGAALLTAVSCSVVLITTWGGTQYGWGSAVIIGLALLAAVATVLFVAVERRAAEPVLPLDMFRSANFSLIIAVSFLIGFVLVSCITFLSLYQQAVQGASATNSGLGLLPVLLSMAVVNVFAGRLMAKNGAYRTYALIGAALMTVSLVFFAQVDTETTRLAAAIYMAGLGAGLGLLMQTSLMIALSSVDMKNLGVASSTTTLFRTIGGSVGVSITGALFTSRVQDVMAERGGAAAARIVAESAQLNAASLNRLPEAARTAYQYAVAAGTQRAFLAASVASLIGLGAVWFVRHVPQLLTGGAPQASQGVAVDQPAPQRSRRVPARSGARRVLVGSGAAVFACAVGVYVVAFAIADAGVTRGTNVLGVDVGGMTRAEAAAAIRTAATARESEPLKVRVDGLDVEFVPSASGLSIDVPATVDRASQRSLNPARLVPALFGAERTVEPQVRVDDGVLGAALRRIAHSVDRPVQEGGIRFHALKPVAAQRRAGRVLDLPAATRALRAAFASGAGRVSLPMREVEPKASPAEISEVMAGYARRAVSAPVILNVAGVRVTVPPETIAAHLSIVPGPDGALAPRLDGARLRSVIAPTIARVERAPRNASIQLVAGVPQIIEATDGQQVTPTDLAATMLGVLDNADDRTASIEPSTVQPPLTGAMIRQLGIKEVIGQSTTRFPTAPYTVQNVHRTADLIDGAVIEPRSIWSLNRAVGRRTVTRGFAGGPMQDGRFVEDYGGGTSQVATTTFDAAFSAGLKIVERRPHSGYLSRYPAGRDATVAWGGADLRIHNDSPYGVYVETVYSGRSVTVRLWSTKRYDVETSQSRRYRFTSGRSVFDPSSTCEPRAAVPGFDVDVVRTFKNLAGTVVWRDQLHTRYSAANGVRCRSRSPESTREPSASRPEPPPAEPPAPRPGRPAESPAPRPSPTVPAVPPTSPAPPP